jgi:hypothetical protein
MLLEGRILRRSMSIEETFFVAFTQSTTHWSRSGRPCTFKEQPTHITASDRTSLETQLISTFGPLTMTISSAKNSSKWGVWMNTEEMRRHTSFSSFMRIWQRERKLTARKMIQWSSSISIGKIECKLIEYFASCDLLTHDHRGILPSDNSSRTDCILSSSTDPRKARDDVGWVMKFQPCRIMPLTIFLMNSFCDLNMHSLRTHASSFVSSLLFTFTSLLVGVGRLVILKLVLWKLVFILNVLCYLFRSTLSRRIALTHVQHAP